MKDKILKGGKCYECGKFIPNCLLGKACHCREDCMKDKIIKFYMDKAEISEYRYKEYGIFLSKIITKILPELEREWEKEEFKNFKESGINPNKRSFLAFLKAKYTK